MSLQVELQETFRTRVRRLQRELARAIRHRKAALLLAIYASEWVREEVERELRRFLRAQGQEVHSLRVDEAHSDVPTLLAAHPAPERTVFFVSGLGWGGGEDGLNAYRALNLRRELFIERGLRVVFWLTEGEAVALARHAPDFWAFRHRVVEFVEPPQTAHRAAVARELAWHDWGGHTLREDTEAKIRLREALLADLPQGEETRAARVDLLFTLGGLYRAAGKHEKALENLQQALALDDGKAFLWNGLGNVYRALGRHAEAIAAYQKAIDLDKKAAYPWNGLGLVYRDLGEYEKAIEAFHKTIELDEKYATPWNGLGLVYEDLGEYEKAIEHYRKALEIDPEFKWAYANLGNVYRKQGRHEEAIEAYKKATELPDVQGTPASAHTLAWNGLGLVYKDLGEYEKAIEAFHKAIELDEKYATPWNNLGAVYRALGRHAEAIEAYKKAIELYGRGGASPPPEAAYPWNGLGSVYADLGLHEEAIAAYQKAIELEPEDPLAYGALFALAISIGNRHTAVQILQKACDARIRSPQRVPVPTIQQIRNTISSLLDYAIQISQPEPYLLLGPMLLITGQAQEALSAFQNALRVEPVFFENLDAPLSLSHPAWPRFISEFAHLLTRNETATFLPQQRKYLAQISHMLAESYRALGRHEEAIETYRKAIELYGRNSASPPPEAAALWNNLGAVYRDLGRHEEAIKAYQKAIELDEKFAYPWNGLGNVYRDLGRYEEAIKAYQKAIELDEKFAAPWHNLGNVYRDLGRYEDAIAAYKKSLELQPRATPWNGLGLTYTLQGDLEAALAAFRKAVELAPENGMMRSSLVGILRRLGREAEARREQEIARPLMEKESEYNRACFAAICGDSEEALRLLAIALEKAPGDRLWARQDPDLESLHDDPRFWALVGEGGEKTSELSKNSEVYR